MFKAILKLVKNFINNRHFNFEIKLCLIYWPMAILNIKQQRLGSAADGQHATCLMVGNRHDAKPPKGSSAGALRNATCVLVRFWNTNNKKQHQHQNTSLHCFQTKPNECKHTKYPYIHSHLNIHDRGDHGQHVSDIVSHVQAYISPLFMYAHTMFIND